MTLRSMFPSNPARAEALYQAIFCDSPETDEQESIDLERLIEEAAHELDDK